MTALVVGLVWPYASWGGAQTHLLGLASGSSQGHQWFAFVPASPPRALSALLDDVGVGVVEAGRATSDDDRQTFASRVWRRFENLASSQQMWRSITAHRPAPDVFHVDIPLWSGTLLVHALLTRAPVVQTFHTPMPAPRRAVRDVWLRTKLRSVARRSGYRLLAATETTATSLRPWVGAAVPIDVVGTVDVSAATEAASASVDAVRRELGVPAGRVVVGTLGQLIDRKGLDVLIDAARAVIGSGVDVHVLLGGDGPSAPALTRRAEDAGIADRVTIVPSAQLGASHAQQLRLLSAIDILVMPSRDEGLPLTLLEALVMRRPAIVSDVGAIGEVFTDGEHVLLVPADDAASVAESILRLLGDDELRVRLAAAGAARVLECFEPIEASRRHDRILAQLVAARRSRRRR